jgi:hypothetical protein
MATTEGHATLEEGDEKEEDENDDDDDDEEDDEDLDDADFDPDQRDSSPERTPRMLAAAVPADVQRPIALPQPEQQAPSLQQPQPQTSPEDSIRDGVARSASCASQEEARTESLLRNGGRKRKLGEQGEQDASVDSHQPNGGKDSPPSPAPPPVDANAMDLHVANEQSQKRIKNVDRK